jgi:hypothetical protein
MRVAKTPFSVIARSAATWQSRQKKLASFRFRGLRKHRENSIFVPSFFLSAANRMICGG